MLPAAVPVPAAPRLAEIFLRRAEKTARPETGIIRGEEAQEEDTAQTRFPYRLLRQTPEAKEEVLQE